MLVTNTKGEKSWSLTLALTSFFVVTLIIVLGSIFPNYFFIPDAAVLIGYLLASLALYFGRRATDRYIPSVYDRYGNVPPEPYYPDPGYSEY